MLNSPRLGPAVDRLAWGLALLFLLDRALRLLAARAFFHRPPPPEPAAWPAVTLICPVTRSPNDLRGVLEARARLDYPGRQRCLLVCDAGDAASQTTCREVMGAHPAWDAAIILIQPEAGAVASKVAKMGAALARAEGEVLCFVDDDVALRPDALRVLVPHALRPEVGAAFGLACYTAWGTLAERLMSGFVNTSAVLSYVPITFLAEPFTITGHCFAMTRERFAAVGGLGGLEGRVDDDHELARRVRRHGLRNAQTPLVYDVDNRLATLGDYHNQLRRWMLIPRQTMLPQLGRRDRAALAVASGGAMLPPLSALLALATRRPAALAALALSLAGFTLAYAVVERDYLGRPMPARARALLPLLAWVTPLHVSLAALGDDTARWRGQRLRIERGGRLTVLPTEEG